MTNAPLVGDAFGAGAGIYQDKLPVRTRGAAAGCSAEES